MVCVLLTAGSRREILRREVTDHATTVLLWQSEVSGRKVVDEAGKVRGGRKRLRDAACAHVDAADGSLVGPVLAELCKLRRLGVR